MKPYRLVPSFVVAGLAIACGGAQKPASPAPTSAPTAQDEPPSSAKSEPAPPPPEPVEEPPETATAPPEQPAVMVRPPSDIIGAPRVAYMINYPSSNVQRLDAAKCDKKTGGDPALHADCMNKTRGEFLSDVLVFKKDEEAWFLYVYKRNRGTLLEVSRTPIEFGEETEDTVKVAVTGNSKGTRPLLIGQKEFVVRLPSKYTLELDDPRFGKLLYDSKIGLVGDD